MPKLPTNATANFPLKFRLHFRPWTNYRSKDMLANFSVYQDRSLLDIVSIRCFSALLQPKSFRLRSSSEKSWFSSWLLQSWQHRKQLCGSAATLANWQVVQGTHFSQIQFIKSRKSAEFESKLNNQFSESIQHAACASHPVEEESVRNSKQNTRRNGETWESQSDGPTAYLLMTSWAASSVSKSTSSRTNGSGASSSDADVSPWAGAFSCGGLLICIPVTVQLPFRIQ